jgi:hypothetical protein
MKKKGTEYQERMAVHLFPAFMYAVKDGMKQVSGPLVAAERM